MVNAALLGRVKRLSAAERMELISAVWETFESDEIPASDSETTMLNARLKDAEENPHDQSIWPEVRERLKRRLR